jgi:light-regulated signal transduction histidine kinase (bacteriophytochrome)
MRSLESSNKELESFAYIASHDLQEPLRKVQAFSDRIKTKYASVLDEQGMDYLTRMESSGRRMQTMVNDLLAFSRVKTQGKAFVEINLNGIIKEVITDLEILIKESGASIEVDDLPIIEADSHQIQQLFLNLISNALKFQSKGVCPCVKIYQNMDNETHPDSNSFCKIIVEDNGIGFENQYLDRIFKPFQRLHGRDAYKGTGIGLAICSRIIERHGGSLTADSKLGHGTKFIFIVPIKQNR